jgi:hypothetical protein
MQQQRAKRPIEIQDLVVWVIRDQKAHRIDGAGIGLFEGELAAEGRRVYRRSADGVAATMDNIGIGGRIQRIGHDSGELHPDAELVWGLIAKLPDPCRLPVIEAGRTGEPPQGAWLPEPGLVPVWRKGPRFDREGRPAEGSFKMIYDSNRNAISCPLEPEHEPSYIASVREEYRNWRAGLEHVARALIAEPERLRRWSVRPPRFADAPWDMPAAALLGPLAAASLDNTKSP